MKKIMKGNIILISLIVSTFYLLLTTNVLAQEALPLTVFPAIQDKTVKPGEKTRLQIQFKNGSDTVVSGIIRVADFVVVDNQGSPQLIENAPVKPKYSASAWINPSVDRIAIPPRDFVSIDLAITVPQEISTCGKYALVYFEPDISGSLSSPTQALEKKSATAVTGKLGGIVNFTVENKECKEGMQVVNFKAPKFLEYGPISLSFDLLNSSDIHIVPKGMVVATNFFGQPVTQQLIDDKRIFPEAAKTYEVNLGSKWMFGRFKINLESSFGQKGKTVSSQVYVWVFPWRVTLIVVLAILIIVLFGNSLYKKTLLKESELEEELEKEKKEIEKLKRELHQKEE